MKPTVLGIAVVLALLAAGAIFFASAAFAPVERAADQTYANDTYGISFTYPAGYLLSEGATASTMGDGYIITLIREEDAVPRINGEGPTSITLIIYGANKPLELGAWLSGTAESNFALGDGTYASTTVDGVDAVRYRWSGLYEGETTALAHEGRIIAVSATYLSATDQLYADYLALLTSLQLR